MEFFMKRKLTDDIVRQAAIDVTYNGMTQKELAKRYNVTQPCMSENLKYYMLSLYSFDIKNPNMPVELKALTFNLTPEQYSNLVFTARSRLAYK